MRYSSEVEAIFGNPEEFISRLRILNENNAVRYLFPFWYEQVAWLQALLGGKRYILGLKPRQVGFTTVTAAFLFWIAYTSRDPILILQMMHDEDAMDRMAEMVRVFSMTMPAELRPRLAINNKKRTRLAHNNAHFFRLLAGGRGQFRSWTANHLHATEMAKWPSGSAANRGDDEGGATDEEVWNSTLAAMHDPARRIIVESTGNGPRGLFFDLYQRAKASPEWEFVFVPWSRVPRYQEPIGDPHEFADTLDDDEQRLIREFDLSLEQINWRRTKMLTEGWSKTRFRREYPLTDMEPFLLSESNWFNQERLNAMLRWIGIQGRLGEPVEEYREYKAYESHRRYGFALDPAGGTMNDEASITGLRDDALQVCSWHSNTASPYEQAQWVCRLSGLYGKPPFLIEKNHMGAVVIREVQRMGGVNLWVDEEGKFFSSTGGSAGNSKRDVMAYSREVIGGGHTICNDAETLRQAQRVVEKHNGKVEGSGKNKDDRIMAYSLALWVIRRYRYEADSLEDERERLRNIERQMRRWEIAAGK